MADSLAPIVTQHYNQIEEKGLEQRKQSRIFHMRNFNNWIKSMLIKDFCAKLKEKEGGKKRCLDIGSGKGGDLLKWKKGEIDYLVCADIAGTSVEQCKQRYIEMKDRHRRQREKGSCYEAEFITADCTKEILKDLYQDPGIKFDIVSCQFAFHYCFESLPQARTMLRNISECLVPGGYFIGSVPDAYDIMARLENSPECHFGNDVYSITFPSKDKPALFGAKYDFHLEGVVDCPEFLVYLPVFLKLAEECDLELLFCMKFDKYFEEKQKIHEGQFLLTKMQAFETFPPLFSHKKMMGCDGEYVYAQSRLQKIQAEAEDKDEKIYIGTLSQSEWDVICMYSVFAFVKKEKKTPC